MDAPTNGEFKFHDGSRYVGQLENGELNGYGRFRSNRGDSYKGN